jgi:hypothetical protein
MPRPGLRGLSPSHPITRPVEPNYRLGRSRSASKGSSAARWATVRMLHQLTRVEMPERRRLVPAYLGRIRAGLRPAGGGAVAADP